MKSVPGMFDLHCDTLTRSLYRPAATGHGPLNEPSAQLSLDRIPAGKRWVQCYAVFVPDDKRGAEGAAFFDHWAAVFAREMEREAHRVGWCRSGRELTLTITFDEKPHDTTVETTPQEDSSMPSEGDYGDWYEYFRRFFGG